MDVKNIYWLGHDSFRFDAGGKQIYIDPWKLSAKTPAADYIFISHGHYDHFSKDDIKKIQKEKTKIICPADVAKQVTGDVIPMKPNQQIDVDELKIKAIAAYNIDKKFHPKENNWLGFVIQLQDGTKVYHAGDTDFIPEMKTLQVDIAMLPVSGTFVMTADDAALAANTFKPRIVIPMHFGDIVGSQSDAAKFKNGFQGETIIKNIEKSE